jgi:hypothetical protein
VNFQNKFLKRVFDFRWELDWNVDMNNVITMLDRWASGQLTVEDAFPLIVEMLSNKEFYRMLRDVIPAFLKSMKLRETVQWIKSRCKNIVIYLWIIAGIGSNIVSIVLALTALGII